MQDLKVNKKGVTGNTDISPKGMKKLRKKHQIQEIYPTQNINKLSISHRLSNIPSVKNNIHCC